MSKVMVLGANGRLGRAAVEAFVRAGWQVLAQLRRAPRRPLPAGVAQVQCDALDVPALAQAAGAGLDLIVHALNPDYARWDTLVPPLTDAAIRLAEATGATLMLPGNVYNYGNQLPERLTDATPFEPTHGKARIRIELEATLAQAAGRGVRSIVVRAGDFLGDEGTWLDLGYGRALAKGRVTHMGPDDVVHSWAYLPDLAQVFVRVAERRAELPAHASLSYAGFAITGAELHRLIESAVGHPLKRAAFPWWLMQLAAPFAGMPRALLEQRYLWQRPHRLDESRLRALIGEVPHSPPEAALLACVAALPGARAGAPATVARPAA